MQKNNSKQRDDCGWGLPTFLYHIVHNSGHCKIYLVQVMLYVCNNRGQESCGREQNGGVTMKIQVKAE